MTSNIALHLSSVVVAYTAGYIAAHAIFQPDRKWGYVAIATVGVSIAFQIAFWVR